MLKKIILIAAALLIAYLLVVGVPRWIGKEKAAESQRNDQMEEQANRRANSIAPGANGGGGPGGDNIRRARQNAAFSVNRSADETEANDESENPPPSEEEQQ